jgi:putative bacteriocin precursor
MCAAYKLGRAIRTSLYKRQNSKKEGVNMKKLNKEYSSMDNTVEAYGCNCQCICNNCSCYGSSTADYNSHVGSTNSETYIASSTPAA